MSKTCNYCGKVNTDDACACGEGQWDGCGAALLPALQEALRQWGGR